MKRITPGLSNLIAQKLAAFCHDQHTGIVFMCPPSSTHVEQENATAVSHFLAHGIPTYQFHTKNNIADSFVVLQSARGVIGPDTFLTHAAEYFLDKPVLNFLVDSSRYAYRVDHRVITVQHPIARQAEENLRAYVPIHSGIYAREIVHPFTPFLSKEEQSHFHPLIQQAQHSLLQESRRGLNEFLNNMESSPYESRNGAC